MLKTLCSVDKPVPRHDPAVWQGQALSTEAGGNKALPFSPEDSGGKEGLCRPDLSGQPRGPLRKQPQGGGHPLRSRQIGVRTQLSQENSASRG